MINEVKNVLGMKSQNKERDFTTGRRSLLKTLKGTSVLGNGQPNAISGLGKRFAKDENGNIAMMFGFGSLVMFVFAGLAVDYTRNVLVRNDMLSAMDAAGLAIARLSETDPNATTSELESFGNAVFRENFKSFDVIDDLDLKFNITQTTITPSITGKLDGLILHDMSLGGVDFEFDNFDISSDTEITLPGSGRIELALVLDVTGSMNNSVPGGAGSKLEDMKNSVEGLLETLYGDASSDPNVRVSVVPFNTQVNVGGLNGGFEEDWLDMDADATYHGARFIHATLPTSLDRSFRARVENSNGRRTGNLGYNNSTGIPVMIDPAFKVNHFHLWDSNDNFSWKGCVEARPYPLDELDTEPGSTTSSGDINAAIGSQPSNIEVAGSVQGRVDDAFNNSPQLILSAAQVGNAINSRWVPQFTPDGANCAASGGDCQRIRQSASNSNIYGFNHRTYYHPNRFDRPSGRGFSNNAYAESSFVNDNSFIRTSGSSARVRNFRIYNDFNLGVRHALNRGGDESNYWRSVEIRLNNLGAFNHLRDEFISRTAYVGLFDPATETYDYRYDGSVNLNLDSSIRNPNSGCGDPILPLTQNRDTVSSHVQSLTAAGSTNSAIGAMWGWRVLSPQPPFTQGVSYDDGQYQKAIVIMTDGQNVVGSRNTHWGSVNTAFGFASEERMGRGINSADTMRDEIDNKMLRICQRMKQEGVLVYTIIFGLRSNRTENLYRACANEPNAPFFHDASDGVDLEEAFGDIAADLVSLHVSR